MTDRTDPISNSVGSSLQIHQHAESCKVAVIGAGPAGLVTAAELLREGHHVTVFEKAARVGGTWVYDPKSDSDPLGLDPKREKLHGSLYRSLRANLPRQLMGFLDYPFPDPSFSFGDPRVFPGHEEVLAFLEEFAREKGVLELVRFEAEVVRVKLGGKMDEWAVECRVGRSGSYSVEIFEAVVVCSGHHSVPNVVDIPGIDRWPGKQVHSHNYRIPEPYRDQVVVLIGKGPSAFDISREISMVAKEVHLASRSADIEVGKVDGHDNIWQHKMIKCAFEDGKLEFDDGSLLLHADVILHCTGFKYHFPFLDTDEVLTIDDNCVGPLYKHVFPPHFAPWLSFVGIPNKVIVFLLFELQAKWIARVLSGRVVIPTEEDMVADVEAYYQELEKAEIPKRFTHYLHWQQVEYLNWLVAKVDLPPIEDWRFKMFHAALENVHSHIDNYRDTLGAED